MMILYLKQTRFRYQCEVSKGLLFICVSQVEFLPVILHSGNHFFPAQGKVGE